MRRTSNLAQDQDVYYPTTSHEKPSRAEGELPTISIVIPTYNEEKNIRTCLDALLKQKYPLNLLEIIIVDNVSTDETLELVKEYEERICVSIIFNRVKKDAELSKMLGLQSSRGELFLYLDADIEVVGDDWLKKIIKPLLKESSLVGSFPRFMPKPDDRAIGRYLRYHPLELDPVFQFFCIEIDKTVVNDKGFYKVCVFNPTKMPPIGICVYRREPLMKVIGNLDRFMDIDVPVMLAKNGYDKFGYVPFCGIYHVNVRNLKDLIKRRLRNIDKIFLPSIYTRNFSYFDLTNYRDVLRIVVWTIYANLFIPKMVKGILLSIKYGDMACMYEPVVSLLLTDAIIYGFVKSKSGREFIRNRIFGVKPA
ncbi:MAG: hypothetical protein QG670_2271 [Thermoproteota archaeon]|nr:hypothetical protein [Thermoproteota archaeon]